MSKRVTKRLLLAIGIIIVVYWALMAFWLPPDLIPLKVVNSLPFEIVVEFCHCKADSVTECGNTYRLGVTSLKGYRATDGRRKNPIEPKKVRVDERYTLTGRVMEATIEF